MKKTLVRANTYRDSYNLMQLANRVRDLAGINEVAIFMGTPANQKRMRSAGFSSEVLERARPDDLCLGLDYETAESAEAAEREIDSFLRGASASAALPSARRRAAPRSLEGALRVQPQSMVASISLPGEYAAAEARRAVQHGLHVFLFSNNVSLEAERELKQFAQKQGRLVMGPDCGTALIGGHALGFCNLTQNGVVGIVAASGTGAQEVACLLDRNGVGTRHILGTGGRDLQVDIGAITTQMALRALNEDAQTQVIALISKPVGPEMKQTLLQLCAGLSKPVVTCFIGRKPEPPSQPAQWYEAAHLHHAAQLITALVNRQVPPAPLRWEAFRQRHQPLIRSLRGQLADAQRFVRGLYSGGSLADEAAFLLAEVLPNVRAGAGFGPVLPILDWDRSAGHMILDLGEDRFTQGKPHPMMDIRTRLERIRAEARNPDVAVLLLDIVLGTNTFPDPAEGFVPEIRSVMAAARQVGRELVVVVHVCGSERDTQDTARQSALFAEAGCLVFGSNVEAAMLAGCLLDG